MTEMTEMTEKITRLNGNGQTYTVTLPNLVIIGYMNEVAIKYIEDNTGLVFTLRQEDRWYAQPRTSNQIVTLLMMYDFKTRYYNNATTRNTIFLKSDHHVGFDVNSICMDCCDVNGIRHNNIHDGRMAC